MKNVSPAHTMPIGSVFPIVLGINTVILSSGSTWYQYRDTFLRKYLVSIPRYFPQEVLGISTAILSSGSTWYQYRDTFLRKYLVSIPRYFPQEVLGINTAILSSGSTWYQYRDTFLRKYLVSKTGPLIPICHAHCDSSTL